MKPTIVLLAAALALVGCSKEEEVVAPPPAEADATEAVEGEAAPAEAAVAAPEEESVGGMMQADSALTERLSEDISAVPTALQNQDYESAVSSLGAMSQVPMDPKQRQAYLEALRRAQEYLLEKAASDAAAKEAYQKLGRQVTGR